jgi:MYXO-CTERM domain-containing protein
VGQDGVVENVRIHHNLSVDTCGFFEVSGFGTFSDSEFYYNVSVDSAWAMLLQVNETTLSNIRWENNTFVHHADAYSPSIAMIYQAELPAGVVSFNNNLVVFDGAPMYMGTLDAAISASNNLIVDHDPGVTNLAGTTADAFDLLAGSEAIDQGLTVPGHNLDFLNRTVPDPGGVTDIGAFEYGSSQGAPIPDIAQRPDETYTTPSESGGDSGADEEGGCNCSVVGMPTRSGMAGLGLLVALGATLIRRRRQ